MTDNNFSIEIAKYFRDFLETNFHKRRAPKRFFRTRNSKKLLIGINLKDFPEIREMIIRSVKESNSLPVNIEKGHYTVGISSQVLRIVDHYCKTINVEKIDEICDEIATASLKITNDSSHANPELFREKIIEEVKNRLTETFFIPLLKILEKSLENDYSAEKDIIENAIQELEYLVGEELKAPVFEYTLSRLREEYEEPLGLSAILNQSFLEELIVGYFNSLKIQDLFFCVNELINNTEVIDKHQFYLYLYDIKYGGTTYPLFYIPVSSKKNASTISLSLDSVVYVNKKAIDFVIESFNKKAEKVGNIKATDNRILYVNEKDTDVIQISENLINEILNYCGISGLFSGENPRVQSFKSAEIAISNNCYFSIFDKSDESLVNDYEELISIVENSKSEIGKGFCALIENLLKENPKKIISDVEAEWSESPIEDKLVNISPIPLNEEQNQILRALKRKDCKYVMVKGPPGTGKSHTITAIIFNAILENKNVLVLSDKTEALDVVEDKITQSLNSVRFSDDFQNPILRLGKTGNWTAGII